MRLSGKGEYTERVGGVLNRQLGPEFVSQRPGQGNRTLCYLTGGDAYAIANAVFGWDRWSSEVLESRTISDREVKPQSGLWEIVTLSKVRVKVSVLDELGRVIRTIAREDCGTGCAPGLAKGAAYELAYKKASTDGFKRALRQFGEVTGNCLYRKSYNTRIGAMVKLNREPSVVFDTRELMGRDELEEFGYGKKRKVGGGVKEYMSEKRGRGEEGDCRVEDDGDRKKRRFAGHGENGAVEKGIVVPVDKNGEVGNGGDEMDEDYEGLLACMGDSSEE